MTLFYAPDIVADPTLPQEEAAHAIRVLRLAEGAEILLTDGKGFFYKALIRDANVKRCEISITERWASPPAWSSCLHIAIAPTKNIDRTEWFCEKATEIGIDDITFLNCRHSERRDIKLPRIEKILISAMKQSQQATLPSLNPMMIFSSFIKIPFDGQKFIAHCEDVEKPLLKNVCSLRPTLILIGPEGDFSHDEISEAIDQGFQPVSLGVSRLRTETAAIVACHTVRLLGE